MESKHEVASLIQLYRGNNRFNNGKLNLRPLTISFTMSRTRRVSTQDAHRLQAGIHGSRALRLGVSHRPRRDPHDLFKIGHTYVHQFGAWPGKKLHIMAARRTSSQLSRRLHVRGEALEGLNAAGELNSNLSSSSTDNQMSIAEPWRHVRPVCLSCVALTELPRITPSNQWV